MAKQKNEEVIDVVAKDVTPLEVVTEDTPIPPAVTGDFEEAEVEETINRINTITPLTVNKHLVTELKNVATLVFLCKGTIDGEEQLFTLGRNYVIDTEEQDMLIECMPFFEEDNFVNTKIVDSYLISSLKSYYTKFDYTVESNFDKASNECPKVYITATELRTDEVVKFEIDAEQFSCISFIESYIIEGIENEHDLALATVAGSKVPAMPATFFNVNKIDSIVSMAPAVKRESGIKGVFSKKNTTSIGIVVKVSRPVGDDTEFAYVLIPFDTGKYYPNSKFKGKTIDDIESTYYEDADQYVSTLLIDSCKLLGVDKEYLISRAMSKDEKTKLFLFDTSTLEILNNMIEEY